MRENLQGPARKTEEVAAQHVIKLVLVKHGAAVSDSDAGSVPDFVITHLVLWTALLTKVF